MQNKRIHYALGALSFLVAFVTYFSTMQPGIPFWDCGEFIGAAAMLGISHPPGTPLWTLIGHVGAWFVPLADLASRYNVLSVLCDALAVMFLYLTTVKVIRVWRGEPRSAADMVVHYGGALLAALSFTWTDSVWFNSAEFIVFSPGLLFIAVIIWLGMIWHEKAEEPGNERYLMLIGYLIGLSIGVHQMSMLAFFPVWTLVYYRHWKKSTTAGFLIMMVTGSIFFAYIFKIVLTGLVGWAGAGQGFLSVAVLAAIIGGIYYTAKEGNMKKGNREFANLVLWGMMMIFLGYSTYTLVMVRGEQDPPMNQHRPSNFSALHEYIARQQYGEASEWPRRDVRQKEDHIHDPTWGTNDRKPSMGGEPYSSEMDFFWRYQTNHMYIRYLLWNFVGRANDNQDAPVDWSHTAGIPLIIGCFGIYWHFRRDPKRALAMMAGFLIMGLLTAWYQNQQDAQPRERDYFYVGAFWIFAMWVGIGATGIMEFVRAKMAKKSGVENTNGAANGENQDGVPILRGDGPMGALAGVFALAVLLVPVNQCIGLIGMASGQSFKQASKWGEYSRAHNRFPTEYAYNILQSCDQDAVLFTAGDNDTFPLWCIQDLYGVRTDVRIVNLSLGNMAWYIKKLKDTPWGAKALKLPSFTDAILNAPDDSPNGVHYFPAQPAMINVSLNAQAMQKYTGVAQPGSFSWKWTSQHPYEGGQYVYEVADQLIKDIVVNNMNDRPIYFAVAVPPSYWTGLDKHVVYEGYTARVVPTEHAAAHGNGIDGDINEEPYLQSAYHLETTIDTKPDRGSIAETFRDPKSNRSGLDERYGTTTYFEVYGRLANHYLTNNNLPAAHRALDTLMARMPAELVDWDFNLLQGIGSLYSEAGDKVLSKKYIQLAAKKLSEAPPEEGGDENSGLKLQFQRGNLYYSAEEFDSARAIFSSMRAQVQGGDQLFLDMRLAQIDEKILLKKGDKRGAFTKLGEMLQKFGQIAQMGGANELQAMMAERAQLAKELGIPSDSLTVGQTPPQISVVPQMQPAPGGAPPPGTPQPPPGTPPAPPKQ